VSASTTIAATGGLTDGLKTALLTLLADDDPHVHQPVRARILASGPEARPWLQGHALSSNPLLRRRVAEILHHLARQQADTDFLAFCLQHGDDCDLEDAVWLLARTAYPEINTDAYRALLDTFTADIQERLGPEVKSLGCLAVINDHLFNELGFRGNEKHFFDPENSYFNRVLDRRVGNPISLCTLYWLLGKRLRLPVVGVGLPRHFLCRYQVPTETVFIDAFNRGKLLTRADCIRFLQQIGQGFQETYLAPTTPGRALLRMCSNLHQIYHELGQREEESRLQRYVVALARH
jgi:regulator of sirC expression with transglutaminase-like and TPR domain